MFTGRDDKFNRTPVFVTQTDGAVVTVSIRLPLSNRLGDALNNGDAFLDAVSPEIAIVPVGYRNRYRHPKPEVMAAYEVRKIRTLRTDYGGMIRVDLPDLDVTAYREQRRRYWMDRPGTESLQFHK